MASRDASFIEMCCTAASACGPARRMSPMWLTSKMPTPVRTAMCSAMMPPPSDAGYSTGMSQPLNSTIFAPIWRWTAFSAVLRTAGVASTEDKVDLNREQELVCRDDVTDYRITRFFGGSNRKKDLPQRTRRKCRDSPSVFSVSSVVKILLLPPELHRHP